jgi:aromatic ring-opening dioxygenase LigB subunit
MSIVFSAIVPHSPFLIPSIGKENSKQLKNTERAYASLEESLYSSKVETIIIISPHGPVQGNTFTMNLSPEFTSSFEDFGDLATKLQLKGDVGLAHKIRENMETKAPLQLISEPNLDYGSGVPLYLLTKHLPNIKIIPLYYSGLDLESHFKFGQLLKHELIYNKNRIAVIASGDLSHKLAKNSPAGYSPKARKFDKKLIEYITKGKVNAILKMKHDFIVEASECGLKSIIILLGTLYGINYEPEILCYEAPFGVGYLTMNFKL